MRVVRQPPFASGSGCKARKTESSGRAIEELRDLPDGQETLRDGPRTLDLRGMLNSAGEIVAEAPSSPDDYLVEVRAGVRVGDWLWLNRHFYYRLRVG